MAALSENFPGFGAPKPGAPNSRAPSTGALSPGAATQKPAAGAAGPRLRTPSAALEPNALKTGALLLILACFAVSGALRANDMVESGELPTLNIAAWFGGADDARNDGATPAAQIAAATPDAASEPDAAALEQARLDAAQIEAAILSGAISTASIREEGEKGAAEDGARGSSRAQDGLDAAARLLQSLRAREAELDAYAERLRQRQVELDAAARRIEERIGELERNKEEFAALVASVDQASERDVEHLIEMYSKMKPKDAGALFDNMAPAFAAGFLGRMRADKASAILANMDREKAYAVSLEIAGRNVQRRPPGAR